MFSGAAHLESDALFHDVNAINKINKLKDIVLLKISSQSGMYFEQLVCENIIFFMVRSLARDLMHSLGHITSGNMTTSAVHFMQANNKV